MITNMVRDGSSRDFFLFHTVPGSNLCSCELWCCRISLCVQTTELCLLCIALCLVFMLLLQKSLQAEMGTEQSSQLSSSGGMEHSAELQKVSGMLSAELCEPQ